MSADAIEDGSDGEDILQTPKSERIEWIDIHEQVPDPIAAALIRRIAERSRQGLKYYGSLSMAARLHTPMQAAVEAMEEAADLALYLELLLAKLRAPRG